MNPGTTAPAPRAMGAVVTVEELDMRSTRYGVRQAKRTITRRLILAIGCLVIGSAGHAFALRCGTGVISTGAHKVEVLQKCGEPDFVEERVIHETRYVDADGRPYTGLDVPQYEILPGYRQVTVPILIEHWTYNFGPHRLLYRLRFVDGGLREISTHGYGN